MPNKLFISHATKDDTEINRIYDRLIAADFSVWVDHKEGIQLGDGWDAAIRQAIANCDAGVFVMSPNSLQSEICGSECLMVRELKKPLYILRLADVAPEHVWLYIKQIQYADLVRDYDAGIQRLIRTLKGENAPDAPEPMTASITGSAQLRQTLPYLFLNPLRGRDDDLQTLQNGLGPYVTQVTGTGGVGKSRLVAELALKYPNGTVWHRCTPNSQAGEVIELLREHYTMPDDAPRTHILARLTNNPPLMVFDNAEDIAPRSDQRLGYTDLIAELLMKGAPMALTSRAVWDELKPRHDFTPHALTLEQGTQIVQDFAASETLTLTEAQARDLADKSRLHPRLMEWSVGQLHERSVDSVLRHLSELQSQNIKDALDEMIHKTIRQMVGQTENGGQAEALLKRITIIRGSFDLAAAAAIQPENIADEYALEEALVTLQRWRFVRRDPATNRYRLDDLVREAVGDAEHEAIFPHYADFYIQRAEQFDQLQPEDWGQLEDDLPDIHNVGDELVRRTDTGQSGDLQRALAFASNTTRYLARRRQVRRIEWLEMGLTASKHQNDDDSIGLFLGQLGNHYNDFGQKQQALDYYQQALTLAQQSGNKWREAFALGAIGHVWAALGEKQKALDFFEQDLLISQTLEDKGGEATTLNNIGKVWDDLGEKRKALEFFEQALLLYQSVGNRGGEATTLNNMGMAWDALGEKRKALDYYEQALPLRRAVGDRGGEATTLNNIGGVWYALGKKHTALEFFEQALPVFRAVGDTGKEATTLNNIGGAWDALGEKRKALEFFEQALPLRRAVGDRGGEATTLNNIAIIHFNNQEYQKAVEILRQIIEIFRRVGAAPAESAALRNLAVVLHDYLHRTDEAIEHVMRSIAILKQYNLPQDAWGVTLTQHEAFLVQMKRACGDTDAS